MEGELPEGNGHSTEGHSTARHSAAWRLAEACADLVLPPLCLACNDRVGSQGALCLDCWQRVRFLGPPLCDACGLPFDLPAPPGTRCGACLSKPPPFQRARAVMRYDDASRAMIIGFKHGDRTEAAPAFGRWLARAGAELLAETDLIVPVPLHWARLFLRRFNQSALLALAVGAVVERPVETGLLRRKRRTPSLGHLSAPQRRRTVAGAFGVPVKERNRLKGRAVVLVDDVLTTGATAGACSRALRRAGAKSVDLLTLARIVRPAI
jgi:ComF family protein